jgi:hypothetical protein
VARRRRSPVPGLVEHTEPLAPGLAHVDPADPHRLGRREPVSDWWALRMQLFAWTAPLLAAVELWVAVDGRSWRPVVAAALFLLSGALTGSAHARYRDSRRERRDTLLASGGMLVALVGLLAGIPFVAP